MFDAKPVEARAKVAIVDRLLATTYGEPACASRLDGTSELVLTILSQHTSDRNSGAAFDRLNSRFGGDWDMVSTIPTGEVVDAIRGAGLANVKGPRIQHVLREIRARRGGFDLSFLRDLPLPEARAWLESLDGVGPKTAACVLLFSYGLPALPVDTHVHRVTRRLGLIGQKIGAAAAHTVLESLVPPERVYPFHINVIRHGRGVCKAPRPLCAACPLTSHCDYFRTVLAPTA